MLALMNDSSGRRGTWRMGESGQEVGKPREAPSTKHSFEFGLPTCENAQQPEGSLASSASTSDLLFHRSDQWDLSFLESGENGLLVYDNF